MKTAHLPWPADAREAVALQRELARRLILAGDIPNAELIAGADCSSHANTGTMVGAVVVWSASERAVVESRTAAVEAGFPYIPGLLAFRELPALLRAFGKLESTPDAVICDGQGTAHMRNFGTVSYTHLTLPTN